MAEGNSTASWNVYPVVTPESVAAAGDVIRHARSCGEGVFPHGGGHHRHVGYPPAKPGVLLSTQHWQQVADYPARDMTITVQAGLPLARLQQILASEGQWLPVDVPLADQTTLGGALAVNLSGPRRYGYGTLRDYVIGIRFLSDEGVEIQGGGRVVKNVAGYDLMKLHIGALGTLGLITQVTLKVRPRPEASAAVVWGCSEQRLSEVLDTVHSSRTRPVAVEVLSRAAWQAMELAVSAPSAPWLLLVGFEEKASTVRWQLATLRDEIQRLHQQGPGLTDIMELAEPAAIWTRLTDWPDVSPWPIVEKVRVRPSQMAQRLLQYAANGDTDRQTLVHAHALTGIIWWHRAEAGTDHPEPDSILWRAPAEYKRQRPVWGRDEATSTWSFMQELKRALDPHNVFNPGRLFGNL